MFVKVLSKNNVLKILGICSIILIVILAITALDCERRTVNSEIFSTPCVIIDAGHGGADGGASGEDGTLEKDLNLDIALRLNEILKFIGYNVYMTRDTDESTDSGSKFIKRDDIKNRIKLMEKYKNASFISVHMNKFPQSVYWGAQTFYSKNHESSEILAKSIQNSIKINIQPDNKREVKQSPNDVYIMKKAKIPAVIVECGFLSNKKELELLKTEEYRSKMAFAIVLGVTDYNNTNHINASSNIATSPN